MCEDIDLKECFCLVISHNSFGGINWAYKDEVKEQWHQIDFLTVEGTQLQFDSSIFFLGSDNEWESGAKVINWDEDSISHTFDENCDDIMASNEGTIDSSVVW